MPKGLHNAMKETEGLRAWMKRQRAQPMPPISTSAGIGINIRRSGGVLHLNLSYAGASMDQEFEDQFDLLEQISEAIEEAFS